MKVEPHLINNPHLLQAMQPRNSYESFLFKAINPLASDLERTLYKVAYLCLAVFTLIVTVGLGLILIEKAYQKYSSFQARVDTAIKEEQAAIQIQRLVRTKRIEKASTPLTVEEVGPGQYQKYINQLTEWEKKQRSKAESNQSLYSFINQGITSIGMVLTYLKSDTKNSKVLVCTQNQQTQAIAMIIQKEEYVEIVEMIPNPAIEDASFVCLPLMHKVFEIALGKLFPVKVSANESNKELYSKMGLKRVDNKQMLFFEMYIDEESIQQILHKTYSENKKASTGYPYD